MVSDSDHSMSPRDRLLRRRRSLKRYAQRWSLRSSVRHSHGQSQRRVPRQHNGGIFSRCGTLFLRIKYPEHVALPLYPFHLFKIKAPEF